MTVTRWPALPCSVVLRPWDSFSVTKLVPLCLKGNPSQPPTPSTQALFHPPTPLYVTLVIFCAMSENSLKTSNPTGRYLYNCLLVAITLLCFSYKSYMVIVQHRKVMYVALNISNWCFSTISMCPHGWFLLAWSHIPYVSLCFPCFLTFCSRDQSLFYCFMSLKEVAILSTGTWQLWQSKV